MLGPGRASLGGVHIEELEFEIPEDDQAAYLEADARIWTAWLAEQPGFVRKEVWRPVDRPGVLVAQIWWATREQWQSITPEQVAEVDARMGSHFYDCTCREYEVVWT
jgi:uncharacterized protein (TIGR03792 family)